VLSRVESPVVVSLGTSVNIITLKACRRLGRRVEHGESGLVVPVNDARALADALRRLARDEELCRRLGEAARERVKEFDLPRALEAWESVVGLTGRAEGERREVTSQPPGLHAHP
jgi:glycosyltransferase involved in cell wall biosynthesis